MASKLATAGGLRAGTLLNVEVESGELPLCEGESPKPSSPEGQGWPLFNGHRVGCTPLRSAREVGESSC